MGTKAIAAGLFTTWAIHDLEEIAGTRYWRTAVLPRLRVRYPGAPAAFWRMADLDTRQMAIAVGLVAVPVALAATRGVSTGGRSPFFQTAVTAYGIHGVGHLAGSVLARDYTPGVLTSPLIVVPYAVWARRQLKRDGVWQSIPTRDLALGMLSLPPLIGGAQGLARLINQRWRGGRRRIRA